MFLDRRFPYLFGKVPTALLVYTDRINDTLSCFPPLLYAILKSPPLLALRFLCSVSVGRTTKK